MVKRKSKKAKKNNVKRKISKPISKAPFVLGLIGAIFILLGSLFSLSTGIVYRVSDPNFDALVGFAGITQGDIPSIEENYQSVKPVLSIVLIVQGIITLIFGIVIIIASVKLKREANQGWGVTMLILSILSLFSASFIGGILALIGSIIALAHK